MYDASPGFIPVIVKLHNNELITFWQSKGDLIAGCITQFAKSTDNGLTWIKLEAEEKSENPLVGLDVTYHKLR